MKKRSLAIIGVGNMAKAIIGGLVQNEFVKKEQILGSAKTLRF